MRVPCTYSNGPERPDHFTIFICVPEILYIFTQFSCVYSLILDRKRQKKKKKQIPFTGHSIARWWWVYVHRTYIIIHCRRSANSFPFSMEICLWKVEKNKTKSSKRKQIYKLHICIMYMNLICSYAIILDELRMRTGGLKIQLIKLQLGSVDRLTVCEYLLYIFKKKIKNQRKRTKDVEDVENSTCCRFWVLVSGENTSHNLCEHANRDTFSLNSTNPNRTIENVRKMHEHN